MATWSAPGRVNLIGEHVDYVGGPVLPFAIDRRTEVAIERRTDSRIVVRSTELEPAELPPEARPGEVDGWERYVAGAIWAFTQATGHRPTGLDIDITSTLPTGAGLSSSAAIECGVLGTLGDIMGTSLTAREIAMLALRAEREFVGVPCGPMDQLAVMLGELDHALLLDSRTLDTEQVPLRLAAAGLTVLVIDTRVRHAVADGAYADRRAACAEATTALGVEWLADATLQQVIGLTDPLLRRRAHHVVSEIQRVRDVVAVLRADHPEDIGAFLTASHRSLADDYDVSCPELDTAVDAALAAGALGARMTGAGFGGSAIALCRLGEVAAVRDRVRRAFDGSGWATPDVWPATPAAGARRSAR
ncbi:MAG: galactokinase [Nocardioidaceae bacterium]